MLPQAPLFTKVVAISQTINTLIHSPAIDCHDHRWQYHSISNVFGGC
jgi:hypothetical protein